MRTALVPLRVAGFRRLLTSYTVNELGDSVALIALSVLVYDKTGDPLATTALFIAAKFLPALLAPALTAQVDQLPVRRVLSSIYLAEALAFVLLAVTADDFLLPLVLVVALLDGTLALAARGISRGAVGGLLGPAGLLRDGNALLNVAFGLASVAGLAAGGIIVAESGVVAALLIDAGSFAVVALLLATERSLPAPTGVREPVFARLRGGLAHVGRHRMVRALLAWQALALIFFTVVIPIEVIYAKDTLDAGDAGFGALVAAWSAGIFAGSLWFIRIRRSSPAVLVLGSTAAIGVAYSGMSAVDDLLAACLFAVLGGIGNGIQWVSVMTLLQEATPVDLQARVTGLLESLGAAMPGVGYLIGGVVTSLASPPTAFAVAGSGVLVLAAAAALSLPRLGPVTAPEGRLTL